ncbi:MAG TPA: LacI family DNA-binding transcriptional regulator [Rariglobus sp.]
MQTIADACGISRMAVSLALRRHPSIPEATRRRVAAKAEKLGYRPNPLVSALMAQMRGAKKPRYQATVAVIHDAEQADWRGMFPSARAMASGLASRADALGYGLDTFWLKDPRWAGKGRLERALRHRGIAGLVVAPLPHGRESIDFDFSGFAASAVGLSLRRPLLASATSNYFQTVQMVHGKLVERGCRRIGLAMEAQQDERVRHQWLGAYLACEAMLGRKTVSPGPCERAAFLRWMKRESLDAVMSLEPAHAAWVAGGAAYACLTLPPKSQGIAGARSNAAGIGAAAFDLVVAQLNRNERGVPAEARVLQIPARWVPS